MNADSGSCWYFVYKGLLFLLLWGALLKPALPSSCEILSQESKDKLRTVDSCYFNVFTMTLIYHHDTLLM